MAIRNVPVAICYTCAAICFILFCTYSYIHKVYELNCSCLPTYVLKVVVFALKVRNALIVAIIVLASATEEKKLLSPDPLSRNDK